MNIWLVIEEIEAGTGPDLETYWVLSAHRSQAQADDAVDAWRKGHGGDGEHAFVGGGDSDWCGECGFGVVISEIEVH